MSSPARVPAPGGTAGRDLVRGAVAGAAGWLVMDQVLRFLYDHESPQVREREDRARGGIPALEVAAGDLAALAGATLSDGKRQAGGTVLQWATGIGGGVLYSLLRGRAPGVTAGRGLAYGFAFALVVDEGLTPLLGLSPGPRAFPWQTHARGLVGHLAYGAVAEAVLSRLDRPA